MDIYLNSGKIALYFHEDLIGIRIICRNLNHNEIAFIEKFDEKGSLYFLLNLDISSLPTVWDVDESDNIKSYKHAKLMIEYIEISPDIKENKLFKIITTSYESKIYLPDNIQPEYYITLPKGKVIGSNWNFFLNFLESIFKKNIDGRALKLRYLIRDKITDVEYFGPYTNLNNEKKRYNYSIKKKEFETINNDTKNVNDFIYIISFKTYFENKIVFVSLFPFFLLLIALCISFSEVIDLLKVNPNVILNHFESISSKTNTISNFGTSFLIIVLSFSLYYYSLIRDGYKLPYQSIFYIILIFTIILCLIDCFF